MKINQAIYDVLDGTGISTDDFPVRKRFVYSELLNTRNELLKQELNKLRLLDADSAQTLHCFELERVDAADCFKCESGIFILRSKNKIPKLIQTDFGSATIGVFLMNGEEVGKTDRSSWNRRLKRRFSLPGQLGHLIDNDYIYVLGFDDVDELLVDVTGHYENPELIDILNSKNANCADKLACIPIYEHDFSCPGHIARRVIEITRRVVLQKLGVPQDHSNNSQFDPNVQSKAQSNS